MKTQSLFRRCAFGLALAAALGGCTTLDVKNKTLTETKTVSTGPETPPFRSITGFSAGLRCMDNLMIDYGIRDVSMLVEDIFDQTKKVNAGTRDMLITAISDMTRRSRAIRVNAFGRDSTNVISYLAQAQRQSAYDVIPLFDIKGSVSQFDEQVIRNTQDLGASFRPFLNLGISRDATSNILGLDLSVLSTADMSVLNGVTSRNSVVILKAGKGFDADAAYHKLGVSFSMSLSRSEGQSQALRGLVELASIELMGKLTKTPYWRCLGADASANEEIKLEMSDWYYAMARTRIELVAYFQQQMRRRGYYDGPIDGQFNPAIDEAIANYREAIGMSKEPTIDEALFKSYLNNEQTKVPRPAQPARFVKATPEAAPAAAAAPVSGVAAMRFAAPLAANTAKLAPGEPFPLLLQPAADKHVYCYLQDESARITRFYPNRFAKDSLIAASKPVALPGPMRFALTMNGKGKAETVACFATPRDVSAQLPQAAIGVDFEPLQVASLDQLRGVFAAASAGSMTQEVLHVEAK
jgi:peptidoglycan hydrolase-like protein with peptidoglycan-binding domain